MDRLVSIGLIFLGLKATNALRADLTLHILRMEPDFLSSHTPGELIERVDGDVAKTGPARRRRADVRAAR